MNIRDRFRTRHATLWRHSLLLAMVPALLLAANDTYAADTVNLMVQGTLRKSACQVKPEDQQITVDMQTINMSALAQGEATPAKQFVVRLQDCGISLTEAKVTISGTGASGNNQQLALDPGSTAQGIAIGFKQGQAMVTELPLNVPSNGQALNTGTGTLYFGAYVQKLPNADLVEGEFQATATLNIEYL